MLESEQQLAALSVEQGEVGLGGEGKLLARGRPVQLLGHRGEWVGEGEDAICLDEVPELDSFVALWGRNQKGGG